MNAEQRARAIAKGIVQRIYENPHVATEDITAHFLSFREETIKEVRALAKDHYWDSLDPALARLHVNSILNLLSEGKGESKEKK